MTRLMHTASALTLATILAAAPVVATAQEATEEDAGQATEGEMAEGEEPAEAPEGTITLQDENSILVSELMGATLYNAADENVGDVNDAILSLDGTVEGVVIGVGGFLGIGEKRVAVELQQISVQTDENGNPRLIIDATRESLEAAPEFVTAEEQRREQEAQQQQMDAGTNATGGMEPADNAAVPAD